MKNQLIEFETAKLAKEKGFDLKTRSCWQRDYGELENDTYPPLDTFTFWDNIPYRNSNEVELIPAPTQSLLQKWLREEKGITLLVNYETYPKFKDTPFFCLSVETEGKGFETKTLVRTYFHKTYEQALEKGLQEALKLIKIKNK